MSPLRQQRIVSRPSSPAGTLEIRPQQFKWHVVGCWFWVGKSGQMFWFVIVPNWTILLLEMMIWCHVMQVGQQWRALQVLPLNYENVQSKGGDCVTFELDPIDIKNGGSLFKLWDWQSVYRCRNMQLRRDFSQIFSKNPITTTDRLSAVHSGWERIAIYRVKQTQLQPWMGTAREFILNILQMIWFWRGKIDQTHLLDLLPTLPIKHLLFCGWCRSPIKLSIKMSIAFPLCIGEEEEECFRNHRNN